MLEFFKKSSKKESTVKKEESIDSLLESAAKYQKKHNYQTAAQLIRAAARLIGSKSDKKNLDAIIGKLLEITNKIERSAYYPHGSDDREIAKCLAYAAALGEESVLKKVKEIANDRDPKSELGKAVCIILLSVNNSSEISRKANQLKQPLLAKGIYQCLRRDIQTRYTKKMEANKKNYENLFSDMLRRSYKINREAEENRSDLITVRLYNRN